MKSVLNCLMLSIAGLAIFCPMIAQADMYSCAKMVYSEGWLRKYNVKGQTWKGASGNAGGYISSSVQNTTESTTSSVDPGVTTGDGLSTSQFSSSWGECAAVEYEIAKQMRDDYLEQNLQEIKKQVAMGYGLHMDSLAYYSGCGMKAPAHWNDELQSHTSEIYGTKTGHALGETLDKIISSSPALKTSCTTGA